jgi:hypothetical protein
MYDFVPVDNLFFVKTTIKKNTHSIENREDIFIYFHRIV